jgi:(4-alkanoyl-5-oxo-2,5-dihydrofuran-3-yl)methyl phosphate reductase
MLKSGMPEALVGAVIELMALIRAGHGASLTPTVEQLLGRKPRTFDEWVRDHAAAFQ